MQQDNADNGPYNMQLKNAVLNGMKPEISQSVRKHPIGVGTAGIQATTDHTVHAENVLKEKKAKKGGTKRQVKYLSWMMMMMKIMLMHLLINDVFY